MSQGKNDPSHHSSSHLTPWSLDAVEPKCDRRRARASVGRSALEASVMGARFLSRWLCLGVVLCLEAATSLANGGWRSRVVRRYDGSWAPWMEQMMPKGRYRKPPQLATRSCCGGGSCGCGSESHSTPSRPAKKPTCLTHILSESVVLPLASAFQIDPVQLPKNGPAMENCWPGASPSRLGTLLAPPFWRLPKSQE